MSRDEGQALDGASGLNRVAGDRNTGSNSELDVKKLLVNLAGVGERQCPYFQSSCAPIRNQRFPLKI